VRVDVYRSLASGAPELARVPWCPLRLDLLRTAMARSGHGTRPRARRATEDSGALVRAGRGARDEAGACTLAMRHPARWWSR
jgi:hypothetical protein